MTDPKPPREFTKREKLIFDVEDKMLTDDPAKRRCPQCLGQGCNWCSHTGLALVSNYWLGKENVTPRLKPKDSEVPKSDPENNEVSNPSRRSSLLRWFGRHRG